MDGTDKDVLRWHQVVKTDSVDTKFALHGWAVDEGIRRNQGRVGAALGPESFRRGLASLPYNLQGGIVDCGDVSCVGGDLETAQDVLKTRVLTDVSASRCPIIMGGGHDLAYPVIMGTLAGVQKRTGNVTPKIAIINFDAHFDLRDAEQSTSGTPFKQAADDFARLGVAFKYMCVGVSRWGNTERLFATANALAVDYIMDDDCVAADLDVLRSRVAAFVAGADAVVLSVCLDVLPAGVAPGVSAPAARGVDMQVVEPLLDAVVAGGAVASVGIAELSPPYDVDMHTARVAARITARIAEGVDKHH